MIAGKDGKGQKDVNVIGIDGRDLIQIQSLRLTGSRNLFTSMAIPLKEVPIGVCMKATHRPDHPWLALEDQHFFRFWGNFAMIGKQKRRG